jgi:succinate-acetate transporter protein
MSWVLHVIIGVLVVALIVLIVVRLRIKRRLESIDGVVGITTHGAYTGKVNGGEYTKVYQHKKEE